MKRNKFQNLTNLLKEIDEVVLFGLFSRQEWFKFFDTSILPVIMLPIIAIGMVVNSILDWYKFIKANNKNIFSLYGTLIGTLSAALVSVSVAGKVIAGSAFAIGPMLFVVALSCGIVGQVGLLITNAYKFFQAPKQALERKLYLVAMLKNTLTILTLGAITAVLTAALIVAAAPAVITPLAITALALTAVNLVINGYFLKRKTPKFTQEPLLTNSNQAIVDENDGPQIVGEHQRRASNSLFHRAYHHQTVKDMLNAGDPDAAHAYLVNTIAAKKQQIDPNQTYTNEQVLHAIQLPTQATQKLPKTLQKLAALTMAEHYLDQNARFELNEINTLLPKLNQSFFADVSDTKDILRAAHIYTNATAELGEYSEEEAASSSEMSLS